jgi:hypothetical protein
MSRAVENSDMGASEPDPESDSGSDSESESESRPDAGPESDVAPDSESAPEPNEVDSESTIPPLDAVDSRWWYWIAAYPVAMLLFVPVVVIGAVLFFVPVFAVGVDPQPGPGAWPFVTLLGLVVGLLVVLVVLAAFALAVVFPVALYFDARAVSEADVGWQPDPLLYGLLGLVQLAVTPLVGFVVAVYYLYQRHGYVGVP